MVEPTEQHTNVVYFSYEDMCLAVKYFITEINKLYNIDTIYAIPRGGLILGSILSNRTGLKLILDEKLVNEKTIIIDDICDTGETLRKFINNKKFVLCAKPKGLNIIHNIYWYNNYKDNDWVKFWWE